MPPGRPGSQRALVVLALLALGLAALRLITRTLFWLLPYGHDGLISEAVQLAAGIAAALGLALAGTTDRKAAASRALLAGSTVYLLLTFAGLGWTRQGGLGFSRNDFYLFSGPGCEFSVRFPNPPSQGRLVASERHMPSADGRYAWLADIATVSSLRADCLDLATASGAHHRSAELLLERWIAEDRVQIARASDFTAAGAAGRAIEGSIGGSVLPPEAAGSNARTWVGLRLLVGERSILILAAHQSRDMTISPRTLSFFDSVARR